MSNFIQLSLFDVDEFLEKSCHPFHISMISVRLYNFYMRRFSDSQQETRFFESRKQSNQLAVKTSLDYLGESSLFMVSTCQGRISLLGV